MTDTGNENVNSLMNRVKWDKRFVQVAELVASWSKDPSTKCGAVIVRPNKTIASVGYNGFPRNCLDDPDMYADRPTKYSRVLHAEVNAILNCAERPEGYTLYTRPTCDRCAAQIIQVGIKEVIFIRYTEGDFVGRWGDVIKQAMLMYQEAKVIVRSMLIV